MAREQIPRQCILRTERLQATTWLPSDVEDLLAVHSDPETMRYVRHGRPETRDETAKLIEQYRAEHVGSGFTKWRIADHDDRLIGRAGFGPARDGRELGYTIRRDRWGQGLATEIGSALVSWHLTHAPGCPLYAYVAVENPASQRVLAKLGFEPIGREAHHDVPCELLLLPCTATESSMTT